VLLHRAHGSAKPDRCFQHVIDICKYRAVAATVLILTSRRIDAVVGKSLPLTPSVSRHNPPEQIPATGKARATIARLAPCDLY